MKKKAETDLMQESTKIVAILNLIRFILLRDKANQTELFDSIKSSPYLKEDLEDAVKLAKAHYELEYRNLMSDSGEKMSQQKFQVCTPKNEHMKEPTINDKCESVKAALQSIDLIESLRVRNKEILEERLNNLIK